MVNALGKLGIWAHYSQVGDDVAREVEQLGYGAVWLGGSPPAELTDVERILDATERVVVATGIVNMWTADAAPVAESYHRIAAKHPGRFLLGVGIGHPEAVQVYQKPYDKIVEYLDQLDEAGVPVEDRALAALGPKVLKLSAERTAGAHPYLTTPEHTRQAREILGEGKLLVPEHKVVLDTDPERARSIGRPKVANPYLKLTNYVSNLKRLGWTDEDIANDGSDRLVDALVLHGDAQQIADGVRAHWDAGADQVTIQVLNSDPLPVYRAVAEVLLS
ncbi:LLM class F420-dependent oxidoreductase [Amycolatopsis bartoniae]|uniref:LLM class F420-dependent oxidoreductase n=1 Tax=Amycolatopsis bartoniae TaxID=941986 RepID=A0A8H9MBI5_9PSEU|nr:LLM class F420-dependent oxidoreductase [Amycolatopsis bartoniae]TVT03421.1 LLM class F420-dependent oxidoreductase [Amycolatopsis bartoniae]GHF56451.1 LLM class F420-dependent oxidoreductase [Amycolatopsis bartoniae]